MIVNRAWFLQRHRRVAPSEILMAALKKKAAGQLKERVEEVTNRAFDKVRGAR